jgi:predicted lipid-binding transport protein (Tim44 family)
LDPSAIDAEARRIEEEILGRPSSRPAPAPRMPDHDSNVPERRAPRPAQPKAGGGGGIGGDLAGALGGGLQSMARSLGTQLGRELLRGVFGTSSKRRRR